jgi:Ca2+/Na+ antiporter
MLQQVLAYVTAGVSMLQQGQHMLQRVSAYVTSGVSICYSGCQYMLEQVSIYVQQVAFLLCCLAYAQYILNNKHEIGTMHDSLQHKRPA